MVNASSKPEHAAPETPVDVISEVPVEVIPEVPADVIPEVATKVVPAPPVRMDVPALGWSTVRNLPVSPLRRPRRCRNPKPLWRRQRPAWAGKNPPISIRRSTCWTSPVPSPIPPRRTSCKKTRELLDDTIQSFGIDARIINVTRALGHPL